MSGSDIQAIVGEVMKELRRALDEPDGVLGGALRRALDLPKVQAAPAAGSAGGESAAGPEQHPGTGPDFSTPFDPHTMDRTVIAIPLAEAIDALGKQRKPDSVKCYQMDASSDGGHGLESTVFPVIIDLNRKYPGGRARARHRVYDLLARVLAVQAPVGDDPPRPMAAVLPVRLQDTSPQYVFADLRAPEIQALCRLDNGWARLDEESAADARWNSRTGSHGGVRNAIFKIWPSHAVKALLTESVATIKANAANATFGSSGKDIVWAVVDSGIDGGHRHFQRHRNLSELPAGISHQDFTTGQRSEALRDVFGHGTHVAGIIAGEFRATPATGSTPAIPPANRISFVRDEQNATTAIAERVTEIRGVAPQCKLVSYKVLDDAGQSDDVRNVIAALEHIASVNEHGLQIRIHGVNLSLGYPYEPRWFACGHSPLCQVIDRLVRSGVVVVAAAGNTGHVFAQTTLAGVWAQGAMLSINDPGNSEGAITVGSTHREEPYRYGASYFSSKGPTGDGRCKPDLLAPGERIISCASRDWSGRPPPVTPDSGGEEYREESGTSMAAPHVSGAIAAFLSVRREFIGRPEVVKDIFGRSASDLGRDRYLQGKGLIDLMRALQSV